MLHRPNRISGRTEVAATKAIYSLACCVSCRFMLTFCVLLNLVRDRRGEREFGLGLSFEEGKSHNIKQTTKKTNPVVRRQQTNDNRPNQK